MVSLHPPFGDIPKKHKPGNWCHIGDWLVLDGHSVNNAICKEMCSLSYISVDDIARTLAPTPEPTSASPTSQSTTSPTHRCCRSGLKPPRPTLTRKEPTDSWSHRSNISHAGLLSRRKGGTRSSFPTRKWQTIDQRSSDDRSTRRFIGSRQE